MKIVVLDDGNRGNFNQAVGIAERLPGAEIVKVTLPSLSFVRRVILLLAANLSDITPLFKIRFLLRHIARVDVFYPFPKPAVIISAGAKLAPVNILLSRCSLAVSVQVLYPDCIRLKLFDLLVMPEHDLWRHPKADTGDNLMVIQGATNRIKPADAVRVPSPPPAGHNQASATVKIAVLVGGDDKNYRISEKWARKLSEILAGLSEKIPAEIYLTTSRRTAVATEDVFRQLLAGRPETFKLVLYRPEFSNPVAEFLAGADLVITTEDSINMVSEAAGSGKPTAVLKVERKREKRLVFDRTLENLAAADYIRLWSLEEVTPDAVTAAIQNPDRKVLAETEKVSRAVLNLLETERVLIVGVSCLGDNLILSPVYRNIRENFPLAKIDVITDLRSAGYFGKHPYFREIFYYNKKAGPGEKEMFLREIREEKYDYVFDFRNSAFGMRSEARRRANFYCQSFAGVKNGEHEADRWLRMLTYFLPVSDDRSFSFPLPAADIAWAQATLDRLNLKAGNFVVLNPGGRWDKKRWPPEQFAELGALIRQKYGLSLVAVGDKNETEIAGKVCAASPEGTIINLSGQTTVRQLTALLAKAGLLVSNDTGTVHLAGAAHCPTAVLFGPGDWRRYGPYRIEYRIISSGLACSPCLKETCPENFRCWSFITPEKVLKEIAPLLK